MIGLRSSGWTWALCTRAKYKSTTSCPARTGKQRWGKHTRSSVWCSAKKWSDVSFASTESSTFLWFPFLWTLPETDHHSYRRWVPLNHSQGGLKTLSFPGETLQEAGGYLWSSMASGGKVGIQTHTERRLGLGWFTLNKCQFKPQCGLINPGPLNWKLNLHKLCHNKHATSQKQQNRLGREDGRASKQTYDLTEQQHKAHVKNRWQQSRLSGRRRSSRRDRKRTRDDAIKAKRKLK